jgi:alkaline phosphatase D
MQSHAADFFLCLGDWPYADNAPGAWSLREYRERHTQARCDERVQSLLQTFPSYAIYDDHEIRNNWDAHFREVEQERIDAGLQAWDEWFPLTRQNVRYRRVRRGQHCELFILDTRLYRSANEAPDGEGKTMLGQEQLTWLQDGLLESDATFKLIATSVPLDFARTEDHWARFQFEREILLSFITTERIHTVIFLTADQHFFAAHHFARGLKEFQTGPLARGLFEEIPDPQPEELNRFNVLNYAEVRIDARRMAVVGRDQRGDLLYAETIEAGIGALRVEGQSGRAFQTTGAHHFQGVAPARFDYAPVGRYVLHWRDQSGDADSGALVPDGELVLGG